MNYINIFASGLNHNTKQLSASFLRIISVTLLMNFCLNLFKNYSQAFGKVYTHLVSSILALKMSNQPVQIYVDDTLRIDDIYCYVRAIGF